MSDTNFGLPDALVSPLYVDGIPLDALNQAVAATATMPGTRLSGTERFWATPVRSVGDTTRDIIEIDLHTARWVNALSFDLAHFPQVCRVEYFSLDTDNWLPLPTNDGLATQVSVTDSVPARLRSLVERQFFHHPQHFGAGHWMSHSLRCRRVFTKQIRFVLTRPAGRPPLDLHNRPLGYSLGLRNFQIGYRVESKADIPILRNHPVVIGETESFASSTDLLGSSIAFSMRENRAEDVALGKPWRCEPQPVPNAVVNFYMDVRTPDGSPQVIDRLNIDPLVSGCSMNIYYSDDDLIGGFESSDSPLIFPRMTAVGDQSPPQALDTGIRFRTDAVSYLEIPNSTIQWDCQQAWWVGLSFEANYDSTSPVQPTLWSTDSLSLDFSGGAYHLRTPDLTLDLPVTFAANDQVTVVAAYDNNTSVLSLDVNDQHIEASTGLTGASTTLLRIGADQPTATNPAAMDLTTFVLKQEPPTPEATAGFLANPATYAVKNSSRTQSDPVTRNALARFDRSLVDTASGAINPYGFLGGPAHFYSDVVWTPINRDFLLRKGLSVFEPVKARHLKLEFTNLTAQPYEVYKPLLRKVQVFTTDTIRRYLRASQSGLLSGRLGGVAAALNQALGTDQVPTLATGGTSPTEVQYAADPAAQQRLAALSYLYRFLPWQTGAAAPRFIERTKHVYETVEVSHDSKVAFFVGIKAIQAYRVDYTADDDTDRYDDLFHDDHNVTSVGGGEVAWYISEEERLHTDSTGSLQPRTVTSKTFQSRRKVRGIQFATVQSPPTQLLADPDFNDPALEGWQVFGDATNPEDPTSLHPAPSNQYDTDIGTTVVVQRNTPEATVVRTWADMASFENYQQIELSDATPGHPTWSELERQPDLSLVGGIASTQQCRPSPAGRIYAAARVVSPTTLEQPLYLQIVDGGGNVLSESSYQISANEVAEWFTGYNIGEGGDTVPRTWADNERLGTYDDLAVSTYDNLSFTSQGYQGTVTTRLVQKGPSSDRWYTDTLSIFDDDIVWEFSNDGGKTFWPVYDIRNNPDGVFIFPTENVRPATAGGATGSSSGGSPAAFGTWADIEDSNPDTGRPTYGELAAHTYDELGGAMSTSDPVTHEPIEDPTKGYDLVWRVTGYRPDLHITSLSIRPWYADLLGGVPAKENPQRGGANIAPYDHFQRVHDDPRWKMWDKPIPEDWYFFERQFLLLHREHTTPVISPLDRIYLDDDLSVT